MKVAREKKIRGYMDSIRKAIASLPSGQRLRVENKLDKISVELKKDRQSITKTKRENESN